MSKRIEIELSKTKILLTLVGSIIFVAIGIYFVLYSDDPTIKIVGIVSILFFGICTIFIARKLFDKRIGLTIDEKGITENTNATSIGLIEWEDITGISIVEIASNKILMIHTNKPEKYIEKAKNVISKRAMKANHKFYGSPLSIISNSLKIKFSDLEKLITEELVKRGGDGY